MKIADYKGHTIEMASPSGGKAGKGNNRTSTIRIFTAGGNVILKAFRFVVGDDDSFRSAGRKAREYIDSLAAPSPTPASEEKR